MRKQVLTDAVYTTNAGNYLLYNYIQTPLREKGGVYLTFYYKNVIINKYFIDSHIRDILYIIHYMFITI